MAQVRGGRDTAIDLETPEENIQISKTGRFYPEDFSDRINLESRKQAVLGEIPKSLAGIADTYNEYKINEFTSEQDLATKKQEMQNNIALEEYKQELELRAKNAAFDRIMLVQSDLDAAKQEAELNPDASLTEAYAQVLDQYKNDPEIQEAGPQFRSVFDGMFNHMEVEYAEQARKFDLSKEQAKLSNNIGVLTSRINADILSGDIDYKEGFDNFQKKAGSLYMSLPWDKRIGALNTVYNTFVQAQVSTIVERVKAGDLDAADAQDELRGILDSTKQDSFPLFEADGVTPLKDKDGNDVFFTPMLDPSVQQLCARTLKDAGNSGGIKEASVSDLVDEFNQVYDVSSIEEKGYSPVLASKTYEEAQADIKAQLTKILAHGPKVEQVRDYIKAANSVMIIKVLGDVINTDKNAMQMMATNLDKAIAQINADQSSNSVDWGNYKLNVAGLNFSDIMIDFADEFSHLGDKRNTYKIVYAELRDQLVNFRNLINQPNKGNLLHIVDPNYQRVVNEADAYVTPSTLITTDAEGRSGFNDAGVWTLYEKLQKASYESSRGGIQPTLPDSFFSGLSATFNDRGFKSKEQKWVGAGACARALRHAGLIQAAYNYKANNPDSKNEVLDYILIADSYIKDDGKVDSKFLELQEYKRGLGAQADTALSNESFTKMMGDMSAGELVKKAADSVGIELPAYALSAYAQHVPEVGRMLVDNGKAKTDVVTWFKDLIKANYVQIEGIDTAVPKQGYVLKYKGKDYLQTTISHTTKRINNTVSKLGVGKNVVKADYSVQTGDIVFRIGTETVTSGVTEKVPVRLWFPANKSIKPEIVAHINEQRVVANLAAGNTEMATTLVMDDGVADEESVKRKRREINGMTLILNDSTVLEELCNIAEKRQPTSVQNIPVRGVGLTPPTSLEQKKTKLFGVIGHKAEDGSYQGPVFQTRGATLKSGNKAEKEGIIDYLFQPWQDKERELILDEYADMYLDLMDIEGNTSLREVDEYIAARNTYVGKINQADISVPLSHAAAGNPSYMDVYSTATAMGFTIDAAPLDGVTLDLPDLPDSPEPIQTDSPAPTLYFATEPMALGTATQIPKPTGKKYTPEEILAKAAAYAILHGVDPNIIMAMVTQESNWKTRAVSKKGAQGLMQLMPATGKSLGVTDPFDVDQNLWAGVKYFKMQLDRFGSIELALAAYNAGPGNVRKAGNKVPNIKETQNYVKKITAGIAKRGGISKDHYLVKFSIGSNEYQLMDTDTGMLSRKGINNFVHLIQNAAGYKGKVRHIYTSSPELLEDKPEYADFAKYRSMKGADGKPLFVKGNYDGFVLEMKRDKPLELDAAAFDTIASDMVKTQYTGLPTTDNNQAQALLTAVSDRYNNKDLKDFVAFGLAKLTKQEYRDYGVADGVMDNPIVQARVLNQEFQRAQDILGSERKAVYAIAGGTLAEKNGERKTWSEVKRDKEAYLKEWFIKPELDDTIRNKVNQVVATYDAEYRRLRGV